MAQKPLDPALAQQALDAFVACDGNAKAAARSLKLAEATFRHRLQTARRSAAATGTPEITSQERQGLRDQLREVRAELAKLQRENITAQQVRTHIFGLAEKTPEPPEWLVRTDRSAQGIAGVPSVLWSDWHWGEVVEPGQVGGINEYNLKIAHARARKLVERVIDLCRNHMTGSGYPGIVVNLGGDMISGDIHEELKESNELESMPALLDLADVLIWALETLADEFGVVFVPCVVGNHGRNTRRPRMKNRVYSNFDWLLYSFLEKHFKNDDRIVFDIPEGTDSYYRVYHHRYLLTHGDSIGARGGDGWSGAVLPIMKGTTKTKIAASKIGQDFDTVLMGHWHQYWPTPRVIVNGSLKGYDEYAKVELRAEPEPPVQALWFTHPKWGVTCHWKVHVDTPLIVPEKKWISVLS